MSDLVLVAGAWLGAWAWDEVAAELRGTGYGVHPLTLTGLAEKRDTRVPGRQAHVRDIVEEVERLGLRDVVLVGHSYAGIPVGQAAERIGGRLKRVVFVDANVPVHGESFLSGWPSGHVRRAIDDHGGCWPPPGPEDCAGQGLTEEQLARFLGGATPHPGVTLTEPAELSGSLARLPATYVKCLLDGEEPMPAVASLLRGDSWERVELDTGHWPMFSEPRELVRVLRAAAGHP